MRARHVLTGLDPAQRGGERPSRVVLGYPYAGAMLCLLNTRDEHYWLHLPRLDDDKQVKTDKWLAACYGPDPYRHVQDVASIALLFDEIYLTPTGDNLFLAGQQDDRYSDSTTGVIADERWYDDNEAQIDEEVQEIVDDPELQRLLPDTGSVDLRWVQLRHALNQVHVARSADAAIFADPAWIAVCRRLDALIGESPSTLRTPPSPSSLVAAGLWFTVTDAEEYQALRGDKVIREYALAFRSHTEAVGDGPDQEAAFLTALLHAMNTETVQQKIAGGLQIAAKGTGILSVYPPLAALGLLGLAADAGASAMGKLANRHKWWTLGAAIHKRLLIHRSERRLKELQQGSEPADPHP